MAMIDWLPHRVSTLAKTSPPPIPASRPTPFSWVLTSGPSPNSYPNHYSATQWNNIIPSSPPSPSVYSTLSPQACRTALPSSQNSLPTTPSPLSFSSTTRQIPPPTPDNSELPHTPISAQLRYCCRMRSEGCRYGILTRRGGWMYRRIRTLTCLMWGICCRCGPGGCIRVSCIG